MPIPKAILEAPILYPCLKFQYDAFITLSSCRAVGMGEGRIPWTAVAQFARHHEMPSEEMDVLWTLISAMDAVYLKHQQKKSKIAQGAPVPAGGKETGKSDKVVRRNGQ